MIYAITSGRAMKTVSTLSDTHSAENIIDMLSWRRDPERESSAKPITHKCGKYVGDIWSCDCGSEIFRIMKSGIYCAVCGRESQ